MSLLKKEILSKFYAHIREEVQTLYLPEHLGYTQSISGTFAVRKKCSLLQRHLSAQT